MLHAGTRITAASLCIFLASCGGGGSDSTTVATNTTNTTTPTSPANATSPTNPASSGAQSGATPGATPDASGTNGTATPPASGNTPPGGASSNPLPVTQPAPGNTPQIDYSKALAARFAKPNAIATDVSGALYISDYGTVRAISPSGDVRTIAGTPGQFGRSPGGVDGTGAAARFNVITGLTVGSDGNLYAADIVTNERNVRRITLAGVVTTLVADSYGTGITADGGGNVYYGDNFASYIGVVRGSSAPTVLTPAPTPSAMTIDNAGNFYVGNSGLAYGPLGQTQFSCTIYRIVPGGQPTVIAGAVATARVENTCGVVDGSAGTARVSYIQGLTLDNAGNLYFTEGGSNAVRRLAPDGTITTLAGSRAESGSADGAGAAAKFNNPHGITFGRDGNLYVADTDNFTIRRVTLEGVVTTVAGRAGESGTADTSPSMTTGGQ